MSKQLKATAYHEAAHAVSGAVLLGHFASVSISGGAGYWHGGRLRLAANDQYSRWNLVILCVAGPYAEARAVKKSKLAVLSSTGAEDAKDAEDLLNWLIEKRFANSMDEAWHYIEEQTSAFLTEHWRAIEAVATRLLERGRLEADELRRLIE